MSLVNKHEPVIAKPLEIRVRGNDFEHAFRNFKSIVQKDGILALYKEKQSYEKPSVKKRRKKQEATEKRVAADFKQKLIETGEWERRVKKKLKKKEQKIRERSLDKGHSNE